MTDRKQFEQEIRENCGEEYLNLLRVEGKKIRRKQIFKRIFRGVIWGLIILFLVIVPALGQFLIVTEYSRLATAPVIQATVDSIEYDEDKVHVSYYFNIDGANYNGNSKIKRKNAPDYKPGSQIKVHYLEGRPSRNRMVDEISPWVGFHVFILIWLYLIFHFPGKFLVRKLALKIDFFRKLALRFEKESAKKTTIDWLEYITSSQNASPRAWFLHCVGRLGVSTSVETAVSLIRTITPARMGESEYKFVSNRFLTHEDLWYLGDYFLWLKYAHKYINHEKKNHDFPGVYSPKKINLDEYEASLGVSFPLIKELADNGSPLKPEFTFFKIDLRNLNEKSVLTQQIKENRLAFKTYGKFQFTEGARRRAVDKALKEQGFKQKNYVCELQKEYLSSDTATDHQKLSDEEALHYQYNLLYIFFETPWRREPLQKEMKYVREDGETVYLRLDFQPGEYIKVSRVYDPQNFLNEESPGEDNHHNISLEESFYETIGSTRYQIKALQKESGEFLQVSWTVPDNKNSGQNLKIADQDKVVKSLVDELEITVSRHSPTSLFFYKLRRLIPLLLSPFFILFPNKQLNKKLFIKASLSYKRMLSRYFETKKNNDVFLGLFNSDLHSMHYKEGKWTLLLSLEKGDPQSIKSEIPSLSQKLNMISSNWCNLLPTFAQEERSARKTRAVMTTGFLLISSLVIGLCAYYSPSVGKVDKDELIPIGLLLLSPVMILCAYIATWFGMHYKGKELEGLFLASCGVIVLLYLFGAMVVPRSLNYCFDQSDGFPVVVPIHHKQMEDESYCLYTAPFSGKHSRDKVSVSETLYHQTDPKRHYLKLIRHPGYLDLPWFAIEGLVEKEE